MAKKLTAYTDLIKMVLKPILKVTRSFEKGFRRVIRFFKFFRLVYHLGVKMELPVLDLFF